MQISWVGWSTTCQSVRVLLLLTYKEQPWRLVTFEIRLMRKHDLTNIYFSLFVDNFLTILTIQRQSWRLATLETLITILTIENLNSDHLWDLAIKSDAGQHSQFLGCFSVIMMISTIHSRFTRDMLPYFHFHFHFHFQVHWRHAALLVQPDDWTQAGKNISSEKTNFIKMRVVNKVIIMMSVMMTGYKKTNFCHPHHHSKLRSL